MPGDINQVDATEAKIWEQEFILDYGQRNALLPQTCIKSGWMSGAKTVTFTIVQDNQVTTTRARNGQITYQNPDQAVITVDLAEALGGERINNFDAFRSSVDQRGIMYGRVKNAIERAMDDQVLAQLVTTTNSYNGGTQVALTKPNLFKLFQQFRETTIGVGGQTTFLLTEAGFLQAQNILEIKSTDYNDKYVLPDGRMAFMWQGVLFLPHPRLTGATTSTAKCYLYQSNAIAWKDTGDVTMRVGFNDEHLYYFCNGQEWSTAKALLTKGIWLFTHDDSAPYT